MGPSPPLRAGASIYFDPPRETLCYSSGEGRGEETTGMTIKEVGETAKQRAGKPLWLTILIFLPLIIVVAYIVLVTVHGIDDIIRERAAG